MRIKFFATAAAAMTAAGFAALAGCGDDTGSTDASVDASADASGTDGGADQASPDSTMGEGGPKADGGGGDAADGGTRDGSEGGSPGDGGPGTDASEAGASVPTFLVRFNGLGNQLPEGLWELQGGTPIVGLAPLATLVTVSADGGSQTFGLIGDAGASNTDTLGIVTDVSGNVYVGVGSFTPDAGPAPAPGVYKFAPDGGVGTLFSSAPGMNFPNGLDFIGTRLFVADSDGAIYTIDPSGTATVWSNDALLAPDPTACDGGVPLSIGANGIVHDTANVYVTNTNHGRIVRIPIAADGGAGTAAVLAEDCASFLGADGVVMDSRDRSLVVAVNIQDKIMRVNSQDGGSTVLTSGGLLDFPASVYIDTVGTQRRLLFTNAAFFSAADAGRPGLLALPIP